MLYVKRLQLSKGELKVLRRETEGYAWVAVDIKRHTIATGSEHFSLLKRKLYEHKSRVRDIWGVGLDMQSGEIDYNSPINRKLMDKKSTIKVPLDLIDKVNQEIFYFFGNLVIVQKQRI